MVVGSLGSVALALYRKYRPAKFAEVVGQEHVTQPLGVALAAGRINHAYLFSGPRGCGKTSSARILARSLNCVEGPTPDPCGVCNSCVALAPEGPGNIDVVELDAASHGGVDDARELRDRAFYAPAESRYRVFIVDEAHMVTTQGFNALLKIVEEPPEHLVFVFATTEPDKVLPTIRSRTHHYPFRLIPPGTLRALLERICGDEGVQVQPAVYPLVIRAGGGSARDTLSVMDQLLAGAGPEGVTYERAMALLGVTDVALIDDVVDALAAGDGGAVYQAVDRLVEAGHDPRRFAADLLQRLRDLMLVQAVPEAASQGLVEAASDELDRMIDQAARLGPATLARYGEIVHAGLTEMRGATAPRLLLELLCARMLLPAATTTDAGLLERLERIERRNAIAPGPAVGEPAAVSSGPEPARSAAPASEQKSQFVRPSRRRDTQEAPAATEQAARAPGSESVGGPAVESRPQPAAAAPPTAAAEQAADAAASDDQGDRLAASDKAGGVGTEAARNQPTADPGAGESAPREVSEFAPAAVRATPEPVLPATAVVASVAEESVQEREAEQGDAVLPAPSDRGPSRVEEPPSEPSSSEPSEPAERSESAERLESAERSEAAEPSEPEESSEPERAFAGVPVPAAAVPARVSTPEPVVAEPVAAEPAVEESAVEESEAVAPGLDAGAVRRVWSEILGAARQRSRSTEALMVNATVRAVDGDTLVLSIGSPPLARRLSEPRNTDVISAALHSVLGVQWRIRVETGDGATAPAQPVQRQSAPRAAPQRPSRREKPAPSERPEPAAESPRSEAGRAEYQRRPEQRPAPERAEPPQPEAPGGQGTSAQRPPQRGGYQRPSTPRGVDDGPPLPPEPPDEEPPPDDEEAMFAEADASRAERAVRRDPEEVAIELLATHLGAKTIDQR